MSKIAQNLYEENQSVAAASTSSSVETASESSTNNFDFSFLNFESSSFVDTLIISIANFNIIWSIAVSFISISNFYFFYKHYGDRNEERLSDGVKYIQLALYVWLRAIPLIIFYSIYVFNEGIVQYIGFGLFVIASIIKWYWDILDLCKKNSYFPWFKGFTDGLRKLLRLEGVKIKSKKKK